jgi:hypothetical protein
LTERQAIFAPKTGTALLKSRIVAGVTALTVKVAWRVLMIGRFAKAGRFLWPLLRQLETATSENQALRAGACVCIESRGFSHRKRSRS